ncbi:MAG: hypothetical protein LBH85_09770 [Treponema sp.]|jgi:hypothetical protein|nr:hypothetical protein [Treponema sp.]
MIASKKSDPNRARSNRAFFLAAPAVFAVLLAAPPSIPAQTQRQAPTLSGVLDTTVQGVIGEDSFAIQFEEYANLRLQTRIKDFAVFNVAFNLIAASGAPASGDSAAASGAGENYRASMELERLSLRLNSDYVDADMGLMRLAFGYGQAFAPSDFLNHRNPLYPNARPRGVLGLALSFYPMEDAKLQVFASAPKDPFSTGGGGWNAGLAVDRHWSRASLQALYVFETPRDGASRDDGSVAPRGTPFGVHRAGLSVKADVAVGLVADALYSYNHEDRQSGKSGGISGGGFLDGLSASGGFDYSFFNGTLYLLGEYLFSGASSATAFSLENPFGYSDRHNIYALAQYAFTDYTNASAACVFGFGDEDFSVTPILAITHELFQGFSLNLTVQMPLKEKTRVISAMGRLKF